MAPEALKTMLELVDVGERSLASYRGTAPDELLDAVAKAAAALRGARILHVNATPYGGGVSELLRSVVPLLNDQGMVAHWRIISGDEPFFQVTKTIHNGLQGAPRDHPPASQQLSGQPSEGELHREPRRRQHHQLGAGGR